jgi:hypothetical protein
MHGNRHLCEHDVGRQKCHGGVYSESGPRRSRRSSHHPFGNTGFGCLQRHGRYHLVIDQQ